MLAGVAILIGFAVGLYAGTVAVFLVSEQRMTETHASLDRIDAHLTATKAALQP